MSWPPATRQAARALTWAWLVSTARAASAFSVPVAGGRWRSRPQDRGGPVSRLFDQGDVAGQVSKAQRRHAALPLPEQFARTAQLQVGFGDSKSIVGPRQNCQPVHGILRFGGSHQNAIRFVRATADAAAKLVELRQPELVGV